MSLHKLHSPSSGARRRICAGSLAAGQGEPNTNSVWAAEGTAYHFVATSVLERIAELNGDTEAQGTNCADWVGMHIHVTPETCYAGLPDKHPGDDFVFKIDEKNANYAQVYVDAMLRRKRGNTIQFYEVKVDTSRVLGIPGQGGTGDMVEAAFTGFAALPAPPAQDLPHEVLGVDEHATPAEIEYAYRRLAQQCHPDKGGSSESMARINAARNAMLGGA